MHFNTFFQSGAELFTPNSYTPPAFLARAGVGEKRRERLEVFLEQRPGPARASRRVGRPPRRTRPAPADVRLGARVVLLA